MKYVSVLKFGLIFFACHMSIYLYAQDYKLDEYLQKVIQENRDVEQSNLQHHLAKEDIKAAKSALLPQINLQGNYQRDLNKNYLFINGFGGEQTKFRTNFNNSVNANVTLQQTLFDPAVFAGLRIVRLNEALSKINLSNVSNEIIARAATLYWQALYTKESIHVLEENKELAHEQLQQIEALFAKGIASQLQQQQASILYQQALIPIEDANNQYQSLLNELKELAHISIESDIQLIDNLSSLSLAHSPLGNTVENNIQIQALNKEYQIQQQQLKLKQKYWYPKLHLITAYDINGQSDNFNFKNNTNKLFYGQVGVNIPLFSGWNNTVAIAKSKIELESIQIRTKQLEEQLLKELKNANNDYQNALKKIEIQKSTIALGEEEMKSFQKQLQLGNITTVELKESRTRLIQSKLDLLNTYLDLHIATIHIKRITQISQS